MLFNSQNHSPQGSNQNLDLRDDPNSRPTSKFWTHKSNLSGSKGINDPQDITIRSLLKRQNLYSERISRRHLCPLTSKSMMLSMTEPETQQNTWKLTEAGWSWTPQLMHFSAEPLSSLWQTSATLVQPPALGSLYLLIRCDKVQWKPARHLFTVRKKSNESAEAFLNHFCQGENEHHGIFTVPPSKRPQISKLDNSEYCRYHQDIGHTTKEWPNS